MSTLDSNDDKCSADARETVASVFDRWYRVKSRSVRWSPETGWPDLSASNALSGAQLVLAFGPVVPPPETWFAEIRVRWPNARLVYTTTGGQIDGAEVHDAPVVLTVMEFERASVLVVEKNGAGVEPCERLGAELAASFAHVAELRHVLAFVDGLHVNGAAFTRGLTSALSPGVTVSGGLASDGTDFVQTGVGLDGPPQSNQVVAIGLSGPGIRVGTGTAGGWIPFGPERTVSRATDASVIEFDGESALGVYKRYLGELAHELPGSALLFPIALSSHTDGDTVVRTILGINEGQGSLRFAGDVPQGSNVRLMRSTNDQLLDGAAQAAHLAIKALGDCAPSVILCISCIGRRAVLKSRIEEELEEVTRQAGDAVVSGYYSNGEIAPSHHGGIARLHNQTMTVTAIGEI